MAFVGTVPAQELHRMAYNALQYCSKDSTVKGQTLWTLEGEDLSVTAYDDYFAVNDHGGLIEVFEGIPDTRGVMDLKTLQELEKFLRDKDKTFDLASLDSELVGAVDVLEDAHDLIYTDPNWGGLDPVYLQKFSVSPDRLRRLSLLKPKGFPIALHAAETSAGEHFLLFRYGPTVRGAISLLNEEKLRELYKGEELWL